MDNADIVTLKPIGDVELWYAEGDDMSWRLPVLVEWKEAPDKKRYALITPGVCFYQSQLMIMHTLLRVHSMDQQLNSWLVPERTVAAVLLKAPGINPPWYYKWPDGNMPVIPTPAFPSLRKSKPPTRIDANRTFAEHISKERHLPLDVVMVVLTAIGQLAPRWLLDRKIIDLGFAKLGAIPFRPNWKEIITFKCKPWKLLDVLKWDTDRRDATLEQNGFDQVACSAHNIGLKRGTHRLEYTIEAIPSQAFEKEADSVELERMRPGPGSYVKLYETAVEELYGYIIDALTHYAKKVAAPWSIVREVGMGSHLAFLPTQRGSNKVRGVPLSDLPTHIVPPASTFSVLKDGESAGVLVQAQDAEVPEMPPVLPPTDDMRGSDVDRHMGQPGDQGTNGMPMLHVGEGEVQRKPMLLSDSTTVGEPSRVDTE